MTCCFVTKPIQPGPQQTSLAVYRGEIVNNANLINLFAQWVGSPVDTALTFEAFGTWADIAGPAWQLDSWRTWVSAVAGRKIILSVPLAASGSTLAQVAAGTFDTYFTQLANNLMARNMSTTIIRLAWEFNGSWYPWTSIGNTTNFINAWRRAVNAMRAAQPTAQFKFDWCQAADGATAPNSASYPGDAYVDYIGIDLYDQSWAANSYPYPNPCDAACHTTRQNNAWADQGAVLTTVRNFAVTHGKPLSIPEWGETIRQGDDHGGHDNSIYMNNMISFIKTASNNIAYQSYFDFDAPDGLHQLSPGSDNHVTSFPVAAAIYRAAF